MSISVKSANSSLPLMQPIQHSRMPLRKGTGMATLYCSFFNGGITRGKEGWSLCKVASVRVGVPGVPCSTMHNGYVLCTSVKAAMISLMSLPVKPTSISRGHHCPRLLSLDSTIKNCKQYTSEAQKFCPTKLLACVAACRACEVSLQWQNRKETQRLRTTVALLQVCSLFSWAGILKNRKFILP